MKTNASKILILLTVAFLSSLLPISRVQAESIDLVTTLGFTVTRSDDRNDACVPGDCSLREAINAANASAADDTINFASGLTIIRLTMDFTINASESSGSLTIKGPGCKQSDD